jgi:hypothetical protein
MAMISFDCPQCKTAHRAGDEAAGRVVACSSCGLRMRVPQPAPPMANPTNPRRSVANPGVQGAKPAPPVARRRDRQESEPPLAFPAGGKVAGNRERPPEGAMLQELADEDEATLRAGLPADFAREAKELGRPRFRVERTVLPNNAYKPAFLALVCCIPSSGCIFGSTKVIGILLGAVGVLGLLAFAAWWTARQWRKQKIYAVVYTGGFVLYDGHRFIPWRWEDVAAVNMQNVAVRSLVLFVPMNRYLTKYYRLRHRGGAEYPFWSTWGPRAAQLGLLVEKETFARMMPAAVARLQAGGEVEFRPFRMKETGLVYKDHFTPWSAIGPAVIERGQLCLRGVGPARGKAAVLLQKIDNHHVFLNLLDRKLDLRVGE